MSSPRATELRRSAARPTDGFRTDLHGLRAFAILLVVVYHVWVGRVSGGVDVFLLLSAYFMTGSLIRRAESGRLRPGSWYVHRFRSLLPPAAATIGLTVVAVFLVFPQSAWPAAWTQSIASLFYVQNWELGFTSVDYYARDAGSASPFLHFWSLSIQGQVFLLWPVLIMLVMALAKLTRRDIRTVALMVFGVVFIGSLAYSIITTSANQSFAYFDTFARLWEFAIGSLLALVPARLVLPRPAAEFVGWAGVVAILTCGLLLDVQGGFPGYLALWPTLATAAIILAGRTRTSFTRFLSMRPWTTLAKVAYPLYLVHWPLLVTWMVVTGRDRPGWLAGSALILLSLAGAVLLHLLVVRPLQRTERRKRGAGRGLVTIGVALALVTVPVLSWQALQTSTAAPQLADAEEGSAAYEKLSATHPGAAVIDDETLLEDSGEGVIPAPTQLDSQWVSLDRVCKNPPAGTPKLARETCTELDGRPSERQLVFVGDSHVEQWMAAFTPFLRDADLDTTAHLLGGCVMTTPNATSGDAKCQAWRKDMLAQLRTTKPDIVVMVGTAATADTPNEVVIPGMRELVDVLHKQGTEVILIRDNPRFGFNMYGCYEKGQDPTACNVPVSQLMAESNPLSAFGSDDGVLTVDLTEYLCPKGVCAPVVGNVAVWLDHNHLTADYATTLAPMMRTRVAATIGLGRQ